jgi:hypothetical protein
MKRDQRWKDSEADAPWFQRQRAIGHSDYPFVSV